MMILNLGRWSKSLKILAQTVTVKRDKQSESEENFKNGLLSIIALILRTHSHLQSDKQSKSEQISKNGLLTIIALILRTHSHLKSEKQSESEEISKFGSQLQPLSTLILIPILKSVNNPFPPQKPERNSLGTIVFVHV